MRSASAGSEGKEKKLVALFEVSYLTMHGMCMDH